MTAYATIDRLFLDVLTDALGQGDEPSLVRLLEPPWRPYHRPVVDAVGERHLWPCTGVDPSLRARLVRMYPQLPETARFLLLDRAVGCGDAVLASSLLALRPPGAPLPWVAWFDHHLHTKGAAWSTLRPGDITQRDLTGNSALGGLVVRASRGTEEEQDVLASEVLPRLLAAGALLDEVALIGTVAPSVPLERAVALGLPDLVSALLEAGASPVSAPPLLEVLIQAWWVHVRDWAPGEAEGRPLPRNWNELSAPSPEVSAAWLGRPRTIARFARCWELLVAAGCDPSLPGHRDPPPVLVLRKARPDWGALWDAHVLEHALEASQQPGTRLRL